MNRIVLIGNGFDLAHGLKTRYEDFINWYWDYRVNGFDNEEKSISSDALCSIEDLTNQPLYVNSYYGYNGKAIIKELKENKDRFRFRYSPFFENICKSIETKGWVDIENEYYALLKEYALERPSDDNLKALNMQLQYLQDLLIEYLAIVNKTEIKINSSIISKIYSAIKPSDISIEGRKEFNNYINWCREQEKEYWEPIMRKYGDELSLADIDDYKRKQKDIFREEYPRPFMLPDDIMLLSFNYSKTAKMYHNPNFSINYIHGELEKPESIIFGYGDELEESFKRLKELNDNECRRNIKSINYLESNHYRNVLAFIESAPFQVYIMGHSCGNSDRTLLNTLFEHKNCISIKPYYYIKKDGTDNYIEVVQNISRNFTDMKLMRDRVVNKTYCETLL
ncbi:MAG: hypothetical protein IKX65_01395 [Prevotella sp.]|nr:hypothetical protein [Prevotella sp.]